MGNCFSGCRETDNNTSSSTQEKSSKKKGIFKRKLRRKKNKISRKTSPSLTQEDKLSVTSIESNDGGDVGAKSECLSAGRLSTEDSTVNGHAIQIQEKPASPGIECGASNARIIAVQPSVASENSSKETFPGEGIKRPITGSESNASLAPSRADEEPKSDDDLEELGCEGQSSATLTPARVSEEPENNTERRSHLQLLEFLRIRLDMAVNNMEINRLIANVDRALDRTSRIRELGFRRMRKAAEARRASRDAQEETGTSSTDGEESGDDEEEEEYEEDDTPPPPVPRICWQ